MDSEFALEQEVVNADLELNNIVLLDYTVAQDIVRLSPQFIKSPQSC